MASTNDVRTVETNVAAKQDLHSQLADYIAQQPASGQAVHKWMSILETVALAIGIGVFLIALYVSFNWTRVPVKAIPTAWLCLPVAFAPWAVLYGLHAVALRVFPPTGQAGMKMRLLSPAGGLRDKTMPLQVGTAAVAWGWAVVAIAVVVAAFWGAFAWAAWTENMPLISVFVQIVGNLMGIAIAVGIVAGLAQGVWRALSRGR
jgi:hypothetical protein